MLIEIWCDLDSLKLTFEEAKQLLQKTIFRFLKNNGVFKERYFKFSKQAKNMQGAINIVFHQLEDWTEWKERPYYKNPPNNINWDSQTAIIMEAAIFTIEAKGLFGVKFFKLKNGFLSMERL